MKKISSIGPKDEIFRNDCKFCNHPFRHDAEAVWEKTKGSGLTGTFVRVQEFFKKKSDADDALPTMTEKNVRLHITNHYEEAERRIRMREGGEHIAAMMAEKLEADHQIDLMLVVTMDILVDIATNRNLDTVKRAETIIKVNSNILDMIKYQNSLRSDLQAVEIVKDQFIKLLVQLIAEEKDPKRKEILMERVDEFQQMIKTV